ncbi:hypothetical protein PPERSA_10573 [Pseudocohnilembus persalinus]|uniref:RAP domain-containing protein n=1 Tax=Pseudocohnilembus persalinus TaxID=266149 RepID=A0A0V0Q977_PSEPJ|nr:hypothetical protein PPERSA_10573 [Pseudocohnilembus persalinus]|eukprot:KRW98802.1 hypothetical protein PPERSA_10573 [Pseudocohnilembus persalinus]
MMQSKKLNKTQQSADNEQTIKNQNQNDNQNQNFKPYSQDKKPQNTYNSKNQNDQKNVKQNHQNKDKTPQNTLEPEQISQILENPFKNNILTLTQLQQDPENFLNFLQSIIKHSKQDKASPVAPQIIIIKQKQFTNKKHAQNYDKILQEIMVNFKTLKSHQKSDLIIPELPLLLSQIKNLTQISNKFLLQKTIKFSLKNLEQQRQFILNAQKNIHQQINDNQKDQLQLLNKLKIKINNKEIQLLINLLAATQNDKFFKLQQKSIFFFLASPEILQKINQHIQPVNNIDPIVFLFENLIEKNYTGGRFYLEEINEFYEILIEKIIFQEENLKNITAQDLGNLSQFLIRCSYYNQELLHKIQLNIMKIPFYGFNEHEEIVLQKQKEKILKVKDEIKNLQYELEQQDNQQNQDGQNNQENQENNQVQQIHNPQNKQQYNNNTLQKLKSKQEKLKELELQKKLFNDKISKQFNHLNYIFKVLHLMGHYGDIYNKDKQQRQLQNPEIIQENQTQYLTKINQFNQQKDPQNYLKETKFDKNRPFLNYFNNVIDLYNQKFILNQQQTDISKKVDQFFDTKYITRALWSLCILENQDKLQQTVPILVKFLFNSAYNQQNQQYKLQKTPQLYQLSESDLSILYMSIIYIEKFLPNLFSQKLIEEITQIYEKVVQFQKHKISMLTLEVCDSLKQAKIPHSIEISIHNIFVDILIQKQIHDKKIILDVHGYQHYFRNQNNHAKGSQHFKNLILKQIGFHYAVIPVFEWELLKKNDKMDYIFNLLNYIKNNSPNQENNQTNIDNLFETDKNQQELDDNVIEKQ